jgi:prepilin-type processing-associated H-X9-DG protein
VVPSLRRLQRVPTYGSYHANGVNALLMDGSVRFVGNGVAPATWRALGTRDGGEAVREY